LPDLSLIMLGAGSSSRFNHQVKKQWLRISHTPLWLYVTQMISKSVDFKQIIVVCSKDELNYMKNFSEDIIFVEGGESRQESLKNALFTCKE